MIILDTTVLIYAIGREHHLRAPCRQILALVRDGSMRATTTVEVIQEFAHVRSRRSSRQESAARAREYAAGLGPLVSPESADLLEALALFEQSRSIGMFDSVLAATARRRDWALVSADQAFGTIDGLTYLDPASPSFLDDWRAAG